MIDHLGLSGRQRFLDIINCSWNRGQLPQDWRRATVIPIKKCGKTDGTPESFRPIALTSITCKIMEKMVLRRLTFHLHSHNLLPEEQSFSFFQGVPQGSVLSPTLFSLYLSGIESVIKRKYEVGAFADDIVLWKSDSDLTKLERDTNLVLEDIRNFALDHKLTFNHTKSVARKRLNILRYISGRDWGAEAGTLRNKYISLIRPILEYGVPVYCSASVTNLQKLEKV
ncbi:putative RNA-directed DNA polymerase from transposon X-element [Trichonephila clavipes]|nr:putative RNA-directed DNA polymerase from transposon X-element [Trichonephila clavipes]